MLSGGNSWDKVSCNCFFNVKFCKDDSIKIKYLVKCFRTMVIEYNVRMGDPETEAVLPRIKTDLVEIFQAIDSNSLDEIEIKIDEQTAVTVMLVSGGYPEKYEKGKEIIGLEDIQESIVFHAGASNIDGKILTSGGRVLAVTSLGDNFRSALKQSYKSIDNIRFESMNYRTDIGFDL